MDLGLGLSSWLSPPPPLSDDEGVSVGNGVSVGVGVGVGGGAGIVAASEISSRLVSPTDSPTEADIQPVRPSDVLMTYQISLFLFLPMIVTISFSNTYPPTSNRVPGPWRKLAEFAEMRYCGQGVGMI